MKARRIAGIFCRGKQLSNEQAAHHHGGRRFGAGRGRKHGCGQWQQEEETVVMRIPKSQVELVKALLHNSRPTEMI